MQRQFLVFVLYFLLLCFLDTGFLCSLGTSGNLPVDQAGLEFTDPPVCFLSSDIKVCTTTDFVHRFEGNLHGTLPQRKPWTRDLGEGEL